MVNSVKIVQLGNLLIEWLTNVLMVIVWYESMSSEIAYSQNKGNRTRDWLRGANKMWKYLNWYSVVTKTMSFQ